MLSCSLFYCISGLFADTGGIVTVRSKMFNKTTEEGGRWEGKGWEKGNKKEKRGKIDI